MKALPGGLIGLLALAQVLSTWAGRPDRTADCVRQILDRQFNDSRAGLPGNDDSGAMSAWFAFHTMGFYPIAGQDVYVISTPSLTKTTIQLENGKKFTIVANHLDAAYHNRYVQSATLNGKPLRQAWFRHSDIRNGGILVMNMGAHPSVWGTRNPPPSLSDIYAR